MNAEFAGAIGSEQDLCRSSTQAPSVAGVLVGLMGPVMIKMVKAKIKAGRAVQTFQEFSAYGNLQPFQLREIEILPEGQRAWKWFALYSDNSIDMIEGDLVEIYGKGFTVMKDADWANYGYHRYNLVEGYDHAR